MLKQSILLTIPASAGVYLFKDDKGEIIYTGKAKNLKKRVGSYFRKNSSPKINLIIKNASQLDYLLTTTEKEALILECSLIKKHKPRYNIDLKDDKNYFNLKIDLNESFPEFILTREVKNDGFLYFGPYTSASSLRLTLNLIRSIFKTRNCRPAKFRRHSKLPCIEYQIGRCSAPCCGYTKKDEYMAQVKNAILFLRGKNSELVKELKDKMSDASGKMNYEYAAKLRDVIEAVAKTVEQQKVLKYFKHDSDVVAVVEGLKKVFISILFIRGGKLIGSKDLKIRNINGFDENDFLSFLIQFYSSGKFIPDEVIISCRINDKALLEERLSELKGMRVRVAFPQKGEKKGLVEMAYKKAENSLKDEGEKEKKDKAAFDELKKTLKLSSLPEIVQCCDISSLSGKDGVGAVVTFKNMEPYKEGYRKYRVKSEEIMDDFGMMYEVLLRHFKRLKEESFKVDLFIVDGGKGHLNSALTAAKDTDITLNVISLSKYALKKKEFLKSSSSEDIYLPEIKEPVNLKKGSNSLLFLKRIRDEAHRFAISYHKKVRKRTSEESILDKVEGIGEKRKKVLLKLYKSVDEIVNEDVITLSKLPGFNLKAAEEVKKYIKNSSVKSLSENKSEA